MLKRNINVLVSSILVLSTIQCFATNASQYKTAINIAGRQRMLTQKISKSVFLLATIGQNAEVKQELNKATALFSTSLNNLLNGNASENIPPAPDSAIKQKYQEIKNLWKNQFTPEIHKISTSDNIASMKTDLNNIAKLNLTLLKECNNAVTLYVNSAKANGIEGASQQINIAGRQRMLSQKIAKEAFMYAAGIDATQAQTNVKKTMDLFDESLQALKNGSAKMNLPAMKNEKALSQIQAIKTDWDKYAKFVNRTLGSNMSSVRISKKINVLSNTLLSESNQLVQILEKH